MNERILQNKLEYKLKPKILENIHKNQIVKDDIQIIHNFQKQRTEHKRELVEQLGLTLNELEENLEGAHVQMKNVSSACIALFQNFENCFYKLKEYEIDNLEAKELKYLEESQKDKDKVLSEIMKTFSDIKNSNSSS